MFQWRRRRERGATLVEAALAFPILILVIISILELGMAFKDYLTVSYLSREAARIGALAGDDPYADCALLHVRVLHERDDRAGRCLAVAEVEVACSRIILVGRALDQKPVVEPVKVQLAWKKCP